MWMSAETANGAFHPMNSRMKKLTRSKILSMALCGAGIVSAFSMTGCQTSIGGQTLPSAYYLNDDIQYFPKGPEFKLSREAAALKEARVESLR